MTRDEALMAQQAMIGVYGTQGTAGDEFHGRIVQVGAHESGREDLVAIEGQHGVRWYPHGAVRRNPLYPAVGDDAEGAPARRAASMSCPRRCGVNVRDHHSTDLVNGGCDTGPMGVADMVEWFAARGVGRPGYYTVTEALAEHYGKTEDELDQINDALHGSMA